MTSLPNAALEPMGDAIAPEDQVFLFADAVAANDWAGTTNAISDDENDYDFVGSDWHRALDGRDDEDFVEVDLGGGNTGLAIMGGCDGWLTVLRVATGFVVVTGCHAYRPVVKADYPALAGTTSKLPVDPEFWDYLAAPMAGLEDASVDGTVRAPSGWLVIIWTAASARELTLDGQPIDLRTACRQAEAAGRDSVSLLDVLGNYALLVRVGTAPLSVWSAAAPGRKDWGDVFRFDLLFADEPAGS